MVRFVDREKELDLLNEAWNSNNAQLVVMYGRRRIGKTTLLDEFFRERSGIFYISQDIYSKLQISELKDYFAEYFKDSFLLKTHIEDWNDLFTYLEKIIPVDRKFYVVLDEFTYLSKNDRSIVTKLQRFWDTFLSRTKVMLVICGSDFGMIQDTVLSYSSPLYGRRSRDILLGPLDLVNSLEFINMDFEEALMLYMTIGGVPEYLTKAENYKDYYFFILREFGEKHGYFYREPYFLLSQEFKDYNTYFSIINAISFGKNTPTEIANFLGVPNKGVYAYLENLVRLGFVVKIAPLFDERSSGHYELNDSMLEFWFNYVFTQRDIIERNAPTDSFDFPRYFGRRFERLVRNQVFPRMYPSFVIGSWWYRDNELDVVAVSEKQGTMATAECKWSENVNPKEIIPGMKEKTEIMNRKNRYEKIEYHIFAKSFRNAASLDDVTLHDLNDIKEIIGAA